MSTASATANGLHLRRFSISTPIYVCILGIVLLVPSIYLALHEQYNLLISTIAFGALIMAWSLNQSLALCLTFIYLLALGDIRRIADLLAGPPALDPLLLVGACFAIYLAVPILLHLKLDDLLPQAVLGLSVLMLLEIFNPRQGPLAVGISGALFCLVPILWFWIGRRYMTERLVFLLLYRVCVPMGVLAALLGICQTHIGFLPWEDAWIKSVGSHYLALNLGGGHIRSFGFSVNSVEFGSLLTFACTIMVAAILAGRRTYVLLLPLILYAMLLASMRTAFVKLVLASAVMWYLSRRGQRISTPKLLLGVVVGLGVFAYALRGSSGEGDSGSPALGKGASAAQYATSHVTQGLSHPLDSRHSTLGLHGQLIREGIANGFRNPIGFGLGSVTLGSGKFGGGDSGAGSTEFDISDQFTTMGFVGGLLYLFIIGLTLKRATAYIRSAPLSIGLPLIGLLIAALGGWIALGQYAAVPFIWILIGFIARETRQAPQATRRQVPDSSAQPLTVLASV